MARLFNRDKAPYNLTPGAKSCVHSHAPCPDFTLAGPWAWMRGAITGLRDSQHAQGQRASQRAAAILRIGALHG